MAKHMVGVENQGLRDYMTSIKRRSRRTISGITEASDNEIAYLHAVSKKN